MESGPLATGWLAEISTYVRCLSALGVGGSPGGDKDEACAQAGVASIQDDLAKLAASK
jgi:uncharacterized protein GlcG (DUF336 family)